MNIDEAKDNIGRLVESCDAGDKMIRRVRDWHGPYKLIAVTRSGFAVLEGRGHVRPSLIRIPDCDTRT